MVWFGEMFEKAKSRTERIGAHRMNLERWIVVTTQTVHKRVKQEHAN